jgi:hypothetical protein
MELNETPTDYSNAHSSQEDDLAHRIRLFKAELDKISASSERLPFKEGVLTDIATNLFRKSK